MNRRERTLVAAVLITGLAAATAWGYARLVDAKAAAATAARNLTESERIARRIELARGTPAQVPTSAPGSPARSVTAPAGKPPELSRRIEAAAEAAEAADSVERIEPGRPRRLGDGPFVEHSTTVELRDVDLEQLFTFLHALAAEPPAVGLRSIRLTAPAESSSAAGWVVEGTLTQTTYTPRDTPGRGGNNTR